MGSSGDKLEAYGTFISQLCLIFGGVLPYIPQYLDILRTGDPSGFSTLVCFFLILANTLRIVYWFGHYFDEALLIQSFIMLLAMFMMLQLCIKMNRLWAEARSIPLQESSLFDFNLSDFWRWTNLTSYFQATVIIAVFAGSLMFAFFKKPIVVEGIGYISLFTESLLALPQFLQNFRKKSVEGMNVMMVLLWTIGDGFKLFFYVWKKQPIPFRMNACIQLVLDFAIFGEILIF